MEPTVSNESLATRQNPPMDTRCDINVHSRRKRLADPDGISAKAVIDALVIGGILPDDSAKYIRQVTFSQEQSQIEETIVDVIFGHGVEIKES